MQMYERILTSINLLIENSKEIQDNENVKKYVSHISPLQFAKDFCTIKVCSARRSGHSMAINKFILDKAAKSNEKWALISHNQHCLERNLNGISEHIKSLNGEVIASHSINYFTKHKMVFANGGEIHFISINSTDNLRGLELDGIIVDCTSIISEKKIEQLYNDGFQCMSTKQYKYLIFVE
jgi:hypothetical protein